MSIFKGAGVAIITPFKENGDVNYEKFAEIIDFQIEGGTDSIIVCGTTGEAACLSEKEHSEVIDFCVRHVAGRVPVVAGTGSNCTRTAISLSKEAEKSGVDALLLVTPYYNKTTQAGLIDHFTTVASSVSLPCILYSVKSRTGLNIAPETLSHLVKNVPNIVGIKEASGDISQVAKIMSICPEVELYSGNDDQVVPLLSLGGLGVISVVSNVAPRYMHDMIMKYFDGDIKGACDMQLHMIDLVEALFCETNPIPVKNAMNMMGMQVGPLRQPLIDLQPKSAERVRKSLEAFGLL